MPVSKDFAKIKGKTVARTLLNRSWGNEDKHWHYEPMIEFTDGSRVRFYNDVDESAGVALSIRIKQNGSNHEQT